MFARLALAFLSLQVLYANGPLREVTSEAVRVGNQLSPACRGGYVYWIDGPNDSYVRVYAPDGHLAFTTAIGDQQAGSRRIQNLAVDRDGTVAVSWISGGSGGRRSGIDFLDLTGRVRGSIDTGLYVPGHLVYGDDSTLWSFGWQLRAASGDADGQDYMTLRRFSHHGEQIGAWLPRSHFPKGLPPGGVSWQVIRITAVKERIGLLAYSGTTGSQQEWLELDLHGNLIGRWRLDNSNFARASLTSDGRVYVQKGSGPSTSQFYILDHAASAWKPIAAPTNDYFCGADGDKLVFASWKAGPMQLRWFDQP
jgi:hypothetical protein